MPNETSDSTTDGSRHSSVDIHSRVLILMCTYEERGNIEKMIGLLHEHAPQADILVVDDNSPDGTGQLVESLGRDDPRIHLLSRSGKLGLGTAVRDGIAWCLERDYDYLVNLDADLSHNPDTVPVMLATCSKQDVDVAVGSRYIDGGGSPGLPPHRKLISRCLNVYANRMLRLPLTDCSGSFRCYSTHILRQIDLGQLQCAGYGFLEEILVALKNAGAKFAEVPVVFDCRFSGKSKLSLKDALGAIRVIHQLAFSRKQS